MGKRPIAVKCDGLYIAHEWMPQQQQREGNNFPGHFASLLRQPLHSGNRWIQPSAGGDAGFEILMHV